MERGVMRALAWPVKLNHQDHRESLEELGEDEHLAEHRDQVVLQLPPSELAGLRK